MGAIISTPPSPDAVFVAKFLTPNDQKLLVASWKAIESTGNGDQFATDMGKVIFVNLFTKYPDLLQIFEHFKEDPNWIENKRFLHHCKIFVNIIGSYIKLLDRPDELMQHVKFLGNQHFFFRINRNHFALAKIEFEDAVNKSFAPDVLTPELKAAWNKLYDLISQIMLDAMGPLADMPST